MSSTLWSSVGEWPEAFVDVGIVDLDVAKTTWSRIHEDLRVMYLRLNRYPPDLQWIKFFHEERESRTMIRRRGLWIEEGYVSFDCLPDEVEHYHLPDIQRSIAYANRKYREQVAKRRDELAAGVHAELGEREQLEAMRARLFTSAQRATATASDAPTALERLAHATQLAPAPKIEQVAPSIDLPEEVAKMHDAALDDAELAKTLEAFRAKVRAAHEAATKK